MPTTTRLTALTATAATAAAAALTLLPATASAQALPRPCTQSGGAVTCTYASGSTATLAIPADATNVRLVVRGAAGGRGGAGSGGAAGAVGGSGAVVTATLSGAAGTSIDIDAGLVGSNGLAGTAGGGVGGGGGGSSSVESADVLVVAAGGGGGGGGAGGTVSTRTGGAGGAGGVNGVAGRGLGVAAGGVAGGGEPVPTAPTGVNAGGAGAGGAGLLAGDAGGTATDTGGGGGGGGTNAGPAGARVTGTNAGAGSVTVTYDGPVTRAAAVRGDVRYGESGRAAIDVSGSARSGSGSLEIRDGDFRATAQSITSVTSDSQGTATITGTLLLRTGVVRPFTATIVDGARTGTGTAPGSGVDSLSLSVSGQVVSSGTVNRGDLVVR